MANIFSSSIGKKLIMSLSGLFLILFLLVHLTINLMLIFDDSGDLFNLAANFMATNPIIEIIEPVLAIGFVIHIFYASYLTLVNMRIRPGGYAQYNPHNSVTWASRNMYILGTIIGVFLVIHLMNFFWKIQFTGDELLKEVSVNGIEMHNSYALVSTLFKTSIIYCVLYIIGAIALGLHLTHGFWSAFQSVGFNNDTWRKRLEYTGILFACIFGIGFSVIPLYFIFFF